MVDLSSSLCKRLSEGNECEMQHDFFCDVSRGNDYHHLILALNYLDWNHDWEMPSWSLFDGLNMFEQVGIMDESTIYAI